jgi:hypothetical protein
MATKLGVGDWRLELSHLWIYARSHRLPSTGFDISQQIESSMYSFQYSSILRRFGRG